MSYGIWVGKRVMARVVPGPGREAEILVRNVEPSDVPKIKAMLAEIEGRSDGGRPVWYSMNSGCAYARFYPRTSRYYTEDDADFFARVAKTAQKLEQKLKEVGE